MDKFQIAKNELYKISHNDDQQGCEELFCKLHNEDYLGSPQTENTNSHNCIACQLQVGNMRIFKFLNDTKTEEDIEYSFTMFILLLYLQVEKFQTIFKLIGITFEYVEQNWEQLIRIRKWANFVKHPKGFLFTHHPNFIFEDDPSYNALKADSQNQLIDYEIIKKFFTKETDEGFKNTIKEVGNKKNVVIVIPCPEKVIQEYSKISMEFCEKIGANPHFKEILKKHTTIEDY